MSALIYESTKIVVGLLYPAYSSFKAVHTKNVKEYVKWMMYWIVFAFFLFIETLSDFVFCWLPFYTELKLVFLIWLMAPLTRGSSVLYRKFIHPQLVRHEKEIDSYMDQVRDQGYQALIALSARGFNFATNIVLTTAIKGSTQLRRSLSLSDLSTDGGADARYRRFARTSSLQSRNSSSGSDEEENERYMQDMASSSNMLMRRRYLADSQQPVGETDMLMRQRGQEHLEALDKELLTNQALLRQQQQQRNMRQQQKLPDGDSRLAESLVGSVRVTRKHRQHRLDVRDADLYLMGSTTNSSTATSSKLSDSASVTQSAAAAAAARPATAAELKSTWLTREAYSPPAAAAAVSPSDSAAAAATGGSSVTIYKRN